MLLRLRRDQRVVAQPEVAQLPEVRHHRLHRRHLSARSLLALLEECSSDATDRATYPLVRQAVAPQIQPRDLIL